MTCEKFEHEWIDIGGGFAKCKVCGSTGKSSYEITPKKKHKQCPICFGENENRRNTVDQKCHGCGKKYYVYSGIENYFIEE